MANPFLTGNISAASPSNNLPIFTEYDFDFQNECFIFENGKQKIVTENEALKIWSYKCLKTERWRYRAYDNAYGIELEQFVGTHTNNRDSATEIERYIKDALLVNPYIESIDEITASIDGDELTYDVLLTSVYGQFTIKNY